MSFKALRDVRFFDSEAEKVIVRFIMKEKKMKKKSNKFLAVLLTLMMAVVFMPTMSFAAGADDQSIAINGAAAKDIKVTMTVNNKGVVAKTNEGKIMAGQTVTVKDLDKDGKMSFDEALVAAHKAYNKKAGYATVLTEYGASVTKLWGVETFNTLFFDNGVPIASNVKDTEIKKGDKLYASINADDSYYSDWYTAFDKEKATVYAKRELTLNLSGFQAMAGSEVQPVKNVMIGTWVKGEFTPMDAVYTDDGGNVTLQFNKKGTYYVTAYGTVPDKAYDYSGYPDVKEVDVDAPIMAPVCKVTVKKAKAATPITVKMTVNNKGVIAKTNKKTKNKIMWNQKVKVIDINKDGMFTYNEALVAAHKTYNKKAGYATATSEYVTSVTKLWGVSTFNTLFFQNGWPLAVGVGDATISKGDVLYASINADDVYYSDWYTTFDKTSVTASKNAEITLNLSGYQGMAVSAMMKPVKNVKIGTWKKGKFVELEGVTTDEEGNATIKFAKKGTYYVTASGTVPDKAYDYSNWPDVVEVDVDAPIMAPVCKVTIK